MFYSHEILTSPRNGVSTIWLAATVGAKSASRKIKRKAIQEVNIPKACQTIIDPGAPIALRLQGNLLFGVARVFSQQYEYMLGDAEKVQAHLQAFYGVLGRSTIDLPPEKAVTRSSQFIIPNDPAFELEFQLPAFDFDFDEVEGVLAQHSQGSGKTSSQLSPLNGDTILGGSASIIGVFDISADSQSGAFQLQLPFGRDSMASQKSAGGQAPNLAGDEELLPAFDDWGIEIDADGNVAPPLEDTELPAIPRPPSPIRDRLAQPEQPDPNINPQGDVAMDLVEGEFLPEAEPLPKSPFDLPSEEVTSSQAASAPLRRRKARQPILLMPDSETKVSKLEFRTWDKDYAIRQEESRNKTNVSTGPAQAAKNAWNLIFGRGIMDVGLPMGIPGCVHPLAEQFSGVNLARSIGVDIDFDESHERRGRRRPADAAFGMEADERRVRMREADDGQAGRGTQQREHMPLGFDQGEMEIGRDPASVLSDIASSVPWNRAMSASVPGSAKAASFQAGRQVSASPLHGRGSGLYDIERFSDQPAPGSDGFGSRHSPSVGRGKMRDGAIQGEPLSGETINQESKNFLNFVEHVAEEKGTGRSASGEGGSRRWVSFDDLLGEQDNKRTVATQAFCNVLELATMGKIKVEQDGQDKKPFGTIRLGILPSE